MGLDLFHPAFTAFSTEAAIMGDSRAATACAMRSVLLSPVCFGTEACGEIACGAEVCGEEACEGEACEEEWWAEQPLTILAVCVSA